jgi:multiple sugar transport system permease protein
MSVNQETRLLPKGAFLNEPSPSWRTVALRSFRARQAWTGLVFITPAIVLNIVFLLLPLGMTFWISFHDWPPLGARPFVGLANYRETLTDEVFVEAFLFTTKYTLFVTPAIFLVAMLLALLVDQELRAVGAFRTVYFIPVVIGFITAGLVWRWIFSSEIGLADYIAMSTGLSSEPIGWLSGGNKSLFSVILMIVWKTAGYSMVLLLAGMQSIPGDLYEAAGLDGAGGWQRIRYITLPLLRPTFALALIVSIIGSYLGFDFWFILTGGGPAHETTTVVMWVYRTSFQFFKMGTGAAMSTLLLGFLVILSYIQIRTLRQSTEY